MSNGHDGTDENDANVGTAFVPAQLWRAINCSPFHVSSLSSINCVMERRFYFISVCLLSFETPCMTATAILFESVMPLSAIWLLKYIWQGFIREHCDWIAMQGNAYVT